MKARDVMTRGVASVGANMSTREVARILWTNGISGVPVVDDTGAPIGVISEADLIGSGDGEHRRRRDRWLMQLAEGEPLNAEFLASLRTPDRAAREIMAVPVVTVGEETEIGEIARLLTTRRIRRVPVVRDGRIVGIVSRSDLLRAFATEEPKPSPCSTQRGLLAEALTGLEQRCLHRRGAGKSPDPAEAPLEVDHGSVTVWDFRSLVVDHQHHDPEDQSEPRRAAADRRRSRVAELIDEHVSDPSWRALLQQARQAAEQGEKEFILLRFPSDLCSDGGRAINVAEPDWPATLRGEAEEMHRRWERDLKPRGFPLLARVLEFPDGIPGDIGLFLVWGD